MRGARGGWPKGHPPLAPYGAAQRRRTQRRRAATPGRPAPHVCGAPVHGEPCADAVSFAAVCTSSPDKTASRSSTSPACTTATRARRPTPSPTSIWRSREGEFVAVVGANGSGQVHAGAPARRAGEAHRRAPRPRLRPRPPAARRARLAARRDVGVLFQNPENQLVAQCVEDDVAFGLENLAWPAAEIRPRVSTRCWRASGSRTCAAASRTCSRAARSSARRWPACSPCRVASWCSTSPRPCSTRPAATRCSTAVRRAARRGPRRRLHHAGDGRDGGRRPGRGARARHGGLRGRARVTCSRTSRSCAGSASVCRRPGSWRSLSRSEDGVCRGLPLTMDELLEALDGSA